MKKKKIIIILAIALLVLILGIIAIYNFTSGDKFKDLDFDIKVTGIVEGNIDENIFDKVDIVEGTTEEETAVKIVNVYNYEGIKISEILDYLNVKEYEKIKFTAIDDYSVEINKDDLENAILMITNDGEVIEQDGGLFKLAVPNLESPQWINSIVEMEIK